MNFNVLHIQIERSFACLVRVSWSVKSTMKVEPTYLAPCLATSGIASLPIIQNVGRGDII